MKKEKNWEEDFPHENGNYYNMCRDCGEQFLGHKRRQVCKECANKKPIQQPIASEQPLSAELPSYDDAVKKARELHPYIGTDNANRQRKKGSQRRNFLEGFDYATQYYSKKLAEKDAEARRVDLKHKVRIGKLKSEKEKEAVEFAEWLGNKGNIYHIANNEWKVTEYDQEPDLKTTQELYELFQLNKNKPNEPTNHL